MRMTTDDDHNHNHGHDDHDTTAPPTAAMSNLLAGWKQGAMGMGKRWRRHDGDGKQEQWGEWGEQGE